MVDFEQKLEKYKHAIELIAKKAEEDGIITSEEASILETAKSSLQTYENTIEEALKDNIIDEIEKQKLLSLEEDLLSDTYFTAMKDNKIDDDELLLLKTLIKSIDPKASVSWLNYDR